MWFCSRKREDVWLWVAHMIVCVPHENQWFCASEKAERHQCSSLHKVLGIWQPPRIFRLYVLRLVTNVSVCPNRPHLPTPNSIPLAAFGIPFLACITLYTCMRAHFRWSPRGHNASRKGKRYLAFCTLVDSSNASKADRMHRVASNQEERCAGSACEVCLA